MSEDVLVVGVVGDDGWALPVHLGALLDQDLPDDVRMHYRYYDLAVGVAAASVLARLRDVADAEVVATARPDGAGTDPAEIRRELISDALAAAGQAGCGHVLIVDPRVILGPGSVAALLRAERALVAPALLTDRCYDLPEGHRNRNVLAAHPGAAGGYVAVRGRLNGVVPCAAATHALLVGPDALRAGLAPSPHALGPLVSLCEAARGAGLGVYAHGQAGARLLGGPEDLYLTEQALVATHCANGTVRIDRGPAGCTVTVGPNALAQLVAEGLGRHLGGRPDMAGLQVRGIWLDPHDRVASVTYQPAPAAQPAVGPAATHGRR